MKADAPPARPGLYVHVPFCTGKCPYCDFYSITASGLVPLWLDGLRREAETYRHEFPGTFGTVFVGGGTPSCLPDEALTGLFGAIAGFPLAFGAEVTVEANPEDVDRVLAEKLLSLGANRVSLGVQSFDDGELRRIGRRHSAGQARRAVEAVRNAGCNNLSLDLMYGLPGQSGGDWRRNLETARSLEPEHLSCYQLTLEKGTALGAAAGRGEVDLPDEERSRSFFLDTSRFLEEAGFVQYEVSNYARSDDFVCRHNRHYWRRGPYLGLGPAAHSFDGRKRWWNLRSVRKWSGALAEGRRPVEDEEVLTGEQIFMETALLGLRTRDGVDMDELRLRPETVPVVDRWLQGSLAEVKEGRLVLTREGLVLADRLALELTG